MVSAPVARFAQTRASIVRSKSEGGDLFFSLWNISIDVSASIHARMAPSMGASTSLMRLIISAYKNSVVP